MNRFLGTLLALATPAFVSQAIACEYPQRAKIPDGKTATKEQMIQGQRSVKAYMAAMEDYLACIEAEEQAAAADLEEAEPEELDRRSELLTKKYNASVEEMEIVAAQFNEQVRAYKAQSN